MSNHVNTVARIGSKSFKLLKLFQHLEMFEHGIKLMFQLLDTFRAFELLEMCNTCLADSKAAG
jgi:hypothetical protein